MAAATRSIAGIGLGLLALLIVPGRAAAQSRVQVNPSLTLVQMYDDNLFVTPAGRETDDIWRLSPRLGIGRLSSRLTLHADYRVDAEAYRRHPKLSSVAASQRAALDLAWRPSKYLAAAVDASYASAQTPGALNTLTGLQAGRFEARRLSATGSLSRRLGALTKVRLEHSFTREHVVDRPDIDTQTVSIGLERRRGSNDRGRLDYSARRFAFSGQTIESHVVTLGWAGNVTSLAHFDFDVGPRLTGHTVSAEIHAGLGRRFRRGDGRVAYVRTQTTVLGEPAPVTAEGVTAMVARQLGRVRLRAGPSLFRMRGRDSEVTVRRLGTECEWQVARRVALTASHEFTLQRGVLGAARVVATEIAHNRLVVGLAAASPAH